MSKIGRRVAVGFAATLLLLLPLSIGSINLAQADEPIVITECSDQNEVFLVITSSDGSSVGSCVGYPASGTDALTTAGVSITYDAAGLICALNSEPDPCPAEFDGKYWQYYQASIVDAANNNWNYATAGPNDTRPEAGWVEGWCYGEECLPDFVGFAKVPRGAEPPADGDITIVPYDNDSVSSQAGLYFWLAGGLIVALALVAIFVLRRRQLVARQA